jgi:hypothetical protein
VAIPDSTLERGRQVARLLSGAWRKVPPPCTEAQTIASLRTTLLHFGSAGLVWWKIKNSNLEAPTLDDPLQQAFRFYALRAAIHEREVARVACRLNEKKIQFVLAKGWALARLYPHPALRPYGDIDIAVRPDSYTAALAALDCQATRHISVDLHARFREVEKSFDELWERSEPLAIENSVVRVLSPEDHLRLVCIHMLYHGAWKHLWLCDVAMMLETLGPRMDWNLCLSGDARRTEWVIAALCLARQVLGAEFPLPVDSISEHRLPRWVTEGIYAQWGQSRHYMQGDSAASLVQEQGWIETFRGRWPNVLQATVRMNGPINDWPRLPFQIADVVRRAARLARQRPGYF